MILVGIPHLRDGDRYADYQSTILESVKHQVGVENLEVFITPAYEGDISTGVLKRFAYCLKLNELIDACISSDASHLWIVDEDTEPPRTALRELLDLDVDLSSGVFPFHNRRELMMFGHMPDFEEYRFKPKDLNYISKTVIGDSEKVGGGSGCLLIKRHVLKTGLRFINPEGRGPDVYFWHRAQNAGYKCRIDFNILCGHLPEFPLEDKRDPLSQTLN